MDKINIPKIKLPKKIEQYRSIVIDELLTDPMILAFLKENNLDSSFVADHIVGFIQMADENKPCQNCKGYAKCAKKPKGFITTFIKSDEGYEVSYRKCPKYLEYEPLLDNYDYLDIPTEEWLENSLSNVVQNPQRKKFISLAVQLLQNQTDTGLYVYGKSGVGKSYLTIALINDLIRIDSLKASFVNVRAFIEDCKQSLDNKNNYIANQISSLQNIDILVLDDLGNERVSEWSANIIYDIVDYRYRNHLLTFYTSNYSLNELESVYEKAKVSRLVYTISSSSKEVEIRGVDLNRK